MSHEEATLVFDFDGTITQTDTIATLAGVGVRVQRQRGTNVEAAWHQILEAYAQDYAKYVSDYEPQADNRASLDQELEFLRGLKDVEIRSVQRVEQSGLFARIDEQCLYDAGKDAVRSGKVQIRAGFDELMNIASRNQWTVSILSVNWSRSFIRGVLSNHSVHVVANEIQPDGTVLGPDIIGPRSRATILTTCADKSRALMALVQQKGLHLGSLVYFGDSTSDIECLAAARGIVVSPNPDSSLLVTLSRIGQRVPHVKEGDMSHRLLWATDFAEVLEASVLDKWFRDSSELMNSRSVSG